MTEQAQQAAAGGEQQVQQPPAGGQSGAGGGAGQEPFWNTLPENMRGTTAEETLKKVMPSWEGYHKAHTTREPALAKAEDFTLEITSDKAKPFYDPKAPLMGAFAKGAVEAGLTKTQASKLGNSVMAALAESGQLTEAFDPVKTVTGIAKVLGHGELNAAAKTALQQFETESLAWVDNTAKQLGLSDVGKTELESLVLTPGGVEVLKALRGQDGKGGFKLGGTAAGPASKDEIFAMLNDERANPLSPKYDQAFHTRAEQAYEALRGSR